jgi:PAS domain S-box-containing protein
MDRHYKALFLSAREGMALIDERGTVLECNPSLGFMLGYTPEQLAGKPIAQLTDNVSRRLFADHLSGLRSLGFVSVELDLLRKNGDIFPVEAGIRWEPEERLFQFVVRDISLKRRLEESRRHYAEKLEDEVLERTRDLRNSEEETRRQKRMVEAIVYGSPIPMFVIGRDHRITHWNRACERLTGFRSEDMIGTDHQWMPFYPQKRPLLADLMIDGDEKGIETLYGPLGLRRSPILEGAYETEHFFPQLGKEGVHLYMNAAPITDDRGVVQGVIVTYQDVTERRRMLRELERREAFVQNLIQNSIDGIIATDEDGTIVIYNRGAEELLGYTAEETVGRIRYRELLSEEMAQAVREAFYSENFGPSGKIIHMEARFLSRDGASIPVRISGTLLYEGDREVGSVVFVQDLREVHRLQKEKQQAQRMATIGKTVAGLAHYIKNILSGLKGGSYVMQSAIRKRDMDLVQKAWGMVERNIDQIANVVADMLFFTKDRQPAYSMVDPGELARDVAELMEERARISGVSIDLQVREGLEALPMDRTAIHRCLLDLISNAIDACTLEGIVEGQGRVSVRVDRPSGWGVRFEVEDNGTGMSPDTQEQLFSDFFSTKGYKGTGLGLPVTQKIVREHRGELLFASVEGKGTTFTLLLPEKPPASP